MNTQRFIILTLTMILTSCFKANVVHSGAESYRGNSAMTSLVQSVKSETGAVTATFSAQSTTTQILAASADEAVSGTTVALPPGALSIDTTISIEEAANIATEAMSAELGMTAVMQQTGTPVSIQTGVPVDANTPFTLAMPLPTLALNGDEKWTNLIVIYKVKKAAENMNVVGIIPRSDITVENGVAKVAITNFGAFQTALTDIPVTEKVQVETKSVIVTKQEVAQLPPMSILSRAPFIAAENQLVTVKGTNFRAGLMLALGGKKVGDLKIVSDTTATFLAPKVDNAGLTRLTAEQDGVNQVVSMFYSGVGDLPVISEVEAEVCAGKRYYDQNGAVKVGTKVCLPAPVVCSKDGETNCLTSTAFPAANKANVAAEKILTGTTIAAVAGTYVPVAALPNCSSDGQTNCTAVAAFPAVNYAAINANLAKIPSAISLGGLTGTMNLCTANSSGCYLPAYAVATQPLKAIDYNSITAGIIVSGNTVAGVIGSASTQLADCAADGATNCTAVANFPAIDKATKLSGANAGKIRSTLTIAGVAGTLNDCSADGGTNCVAVAGFPAANATGAAAKISSGDTLAGIAGTASTRPSDCSAAGSTGCVTTATYQSVDMSALNSQKAFVRSTVVIAGVTGTLSDCSANGSNCYVPNYVTSSQPLKAISYDSITANIIKSGSTIAGVSGSVVAAPADCAADGATACVAVTNYPAMDKVNVTSNAVKMSSSLTAGGVVGTMPDCSSDNGTGCRAVTAYPSVVKSNVTAGVLKSGTVVAGVTGNYPSNTYPLATSDGTADLTWATFNAQIKSTSPFEFFDANGTRYQGTGDSDITAANIKNSINIFGTSGTFGTDCAADGLSNCLTTTQYKSADTNILLPWDLPGGKTIAGVTGMRFIARNAVGSAFNRTSGAGANAGNDIYDTIDDANNGSTFPTIGMFADGPGTFGTNWVQDQNSDTGVGGGTAANGVCDGTESCVYIDRLTNLFWAKFSGTAANWENAISACDTLSYGGFTDYRLPTQKELMSAYAGGVAKHKTALNLTGYPNAWSSTTNSTTTANAWSVHIENGTVTNIVKTSTAGVFCVRP